MQSYQVILGFKKIYPNLISFAFHLISPKNIATTVRILNAE